METITNYLLFSFLFTFHSRITKIKAILFERLWRFSVMKDIVIAKIAVQRQLDFKFLNCPSSKASSVLKNLRQVQLPTKSSFCDLVRLHCTNPTRGSMPTVSVGFTSWLTRWSSWRKDLRGLKCVVWVVTSYMSNKRNTVPIFIHLYMHFPMQTI